jgi:hypothetical protein
MAMDKNFISYVNDFLNRNSPFTPIEVRQIMLSDGKKYTLQIERLPDEIDRPTRFEVRSETGISTGETDQHGDNPTYSWVLPVNSIDDAIEGFKDRIEEIREECGYYELSNGYL